jgi:hypothetical protein
MTRILFGALVVAAFGAVGCETTHPNTAIGAGVGGALGAGTGAAIGAATHNAGAGAAIGGLVGAATGAAIGSEADERDRERAARVQVAQAQAQAAAANPPMGLTDVVDLCKTGASSTVVINQIRTSGSRFLLSTADIQFLTANNVPQDVIAAMQATQNQPATVIYKTPRTVVVDPYAAPVYVAPAPAVIVRPYPVYGYGYYRRW